MSSRGRSRGNSSPTCGAGFVQKAAGREQLGGYAAARSTPRATPAGRNHIADRPLSEKRRSGCFPPSRWRNEMKFAALVTATILLGSTPLFAQSEQGGQRPAP